MQFNFTVVGVTWLCRVVSVDWTVVPWLVSKPAQYFWIPQTDTSSTAIDFSLEISQEKQQQQGSAD